jgi:hypothetical protein
MRTQLLVHHDPAVDNSENGVIDSRVCLSATASRTKTTPFLLGLCNDEAVSVEFEHRCVPLLDTFGRYNVIHENTVLAKSQNIEIDVAADYQ